MPKTLRNYNALMKSMIQKEKNNPPLRNASYGSTNSQKKAALRIEKSLRNEFKPPKKSTTRKIRQNYNEEKRARILKKIQNHGSVMNRKKARRFSRQGTNI